MKESAFKLSARNSLRVNEVNVDNERTLLLTMKGGNDLRNQLSKQLLKQSHKPQMKETATKMSKPAQSEQDMLMQEVAALENFKVPVVRQKTKALIENIKLRRREKHIDSYNRFRQDLDDYRQNLISIYFSLVSDTQQVLELKEAEIKAYFAGISDEYLLTREIDLIEEVETEVKNYKIRTSIKLSESIKELQRIKQSRGNVVQKTCSTLMRELVQIAFVLQDEAIKIETSERNAILEFQEGSYAKNAQLLVEAQRRYSLALNEVGGAAEKLKKRWRELKEAREIELYLQDADTPDYLNPQSRSLLYRDLIQLQEVNSQRKFTLLTNLIKESPETLNKVNNQKWNEHLKLINQAFDKALDEAVKLLLEDNRLSQANNAKRYEQLRIRLRLIGNRSNEEIENLLAQKCEAILGRNSKFGKDLLQQATAYVEKADSRQNEALQKMSSFLLQIGVKNDQFAKEFASFSQQYEMEKAKILDDDDELTDKLNGELNTFKQELKEALHHIRLDEVEKACFAKIDQLEQAYRQTHQKNKALVATRPKTITQFMGRYEAKLAQIFLLFDQSRKNQLIQKNKKEAEEIVLKMIEEQEKKKVEEENKANEQIKKKGGKVVPAKPKDPKKAATEMEQRKKVLLAQIGVKPIEELKSNGGSVWLVYRKLDEICIQFYKQSKTDEQEVKSDSPVPLKIDELEDPVLDAFGNAVVSRTAFINASRMTNELVVLRNAIFESLVIKKNRILSEAEGQDKEMIEGSLQTLDERLKKHYSLKGTIQSEIYLKRSSEITNHKKVYENYARSVKQKTDFQTEKFNMFLEKGLELLKTHTAAQKAVRQQLSQSKTLSQFQGQATKNRENSNNFGLQIKEICQQLERLANGEIDAVLEKNQDFMKKANPAEYSATELEWYRQMMSEITKQVTQQKTKRTEKFIQIRDHTDKKRKEFYDNFEKDYNAFIEQLSAKEGTGKKYGRPKRIAQQKIRLEMNKCEQAQINIDLQIAAIERMITEKKQKDAYLKAPETLEWRSKLMTVQSCIMRYCKHIQALMPNLQIKPTPRVNYNESLPETAVDNQEQDKKKITKELAALGPLADQKDDRKFIKYIEGIQTIISDQAKLIYVGDKLKYVTGTDKIPDFLRNYIVNMKKNAEDFRQASIRQLRESCEKLANLAEGINSLFFEQLAGYHIGLQNTNGKVRRGELTEFNNKNSKMREEHLKALRPNLSNPKCQQELKSLDEKEKKRSEEYDRVVGDLRKGFEDTHFQQASRFLTTILNNFEFLQGYIDSLYLFEDFVKVTGDQTAESKHLDIKKLMLMKQKGIAIDSNSERNIRKKWEGVNYTLFNFADKKYVYVVKGAEQKQKDPKKPPKKDSKDPKKVEEPLAVVAPDCSKAIETFKTWRQKSAFTYRQRVIQEYKQQYDANYEGMGKAFQQGVNENDSFRRKWVATAKELFIV